MKKKTLKRLSLQKEAVSSLQPNAQNRVRGGGSDNPCYESWPPICATEKDCVPSDLCTYVESGYELCNPYLPPHKA